MRFVIDCRVRSDVDFVCDRGSERMYVQVTYLMPTKETREREFGALLAIPDQFPKMVLSLDRLNLGGNGILHKYIPEFLLETEEKEQQKFSTETGIEASSGWRQ